MLGGAALARDLTAMELLRRPGVRHADLLELIGPPESQGDERIAAQLGPALEVRARYTGYIERAQQEIERAHRNEQHTPLPVDLGDHRRPGWSIEVRQKLVVSVRRRWV